MHQNLFSESASKNNPKKTGLVITKATKKVLTKNQQEFNKLTVKIEKLQKEIEKKKLQFDKALEVYGKDIYPVQTEINTQRRLIIILLWDVYEAKNLAKKDQVHLKEIVRFNMETYIDDCKSMELDSDLDKVFEALEGMSYKAMMEKEKAQMQKEMAKMFKKAKIDVGDVDITDPEALAKMMAEAQHKMAEKEEKENERQQKKFATRKKTAKQVEYEKNEALAEELKSKNISTIYKQLAKLFHPDLEQDEIRKAEKSLLMQELIAAYESKNLHALLTLELKWIHNENDHLDSLTEEKLAVYLQILQEQAAQLNDEKHMIYQHHKYNSFIEKFGPEVLRNPLQTTLDYLMELNEYASTMKADLKGFQSDYALRHIKETIKDWKNEMAFNENEDDIFSLLFRK